jgi:hypothetical protein
MSLKRHEDKIRMDLRQTEWGRVGWIHLAQERDQWWALVNTVINFRNLQMGGNFFTRWATISVSKEMCSTELVSYEHSTSAARNKTYALYLSKSMFQITQHLSTSSDRVGKF